MMLHEFLDAVANTQTPTNNTLALYATRSQLQQYCAITDSKYYIEFNFDGTDTFVIRNGNEEFHGYVLPELFETRHEGLWSTYDTVDYIASEFRPSYAGTWTKRQVDEIFCGGATPAEDDISNIDSIL